jgi:hypothetical protein
VRAGWAYHFRDIADRLFVYVFAHLPAEIYVGLTRDARGGIALYGLLFFAAPLIGLTLTFAADRSPRRMIFACACLSTACLCPLVFGFPTEMWVAHALFWPALALCHYAGRGVGGTIAIFLALAALVLTHEGGTVCAVAIVVTVALRGLGDPVFRRAAGALAAALAVWAAVKVAVPPDGYYASIIEAAALNFIDIDRRGGACGLLAALRSFAPHAEPLLRAHRDLLRHADRGGVRGALCVARRGVPARADRVPRPRRRCARRPCRGTGPRAGGERRGRRGPDARAGARGRDREVRHRLARL